MQTARTGILLALAIAVCALSPVAASAVLTNEYGQVFAGQDRCLECHDAFYEETLHGRHVTPGIAVALPPVWTSFRGSGSVAAAGAPNPGSGLRWFTAGGTYPIAGLTWLTMFDYAGDSRWSEEEGRLLFFSGSPATSTASPWNQISGLGLTHGGTNVEYSQVTSGLADSTVSSTCGMVNCHFTGGTQPLGSTQAGLSIPNPSVASQPTISTRTQWARDREFSAADFNASATVGMAGLGVQCEKCHGSGLSTADISSGHFASRTQLSHLLPAATVNGRPLAKTSTATLGRSDVCGACHGLRSAPPVSGVLPNLMGYTPNLFVRDFVSVNATRTSSSAPTQRAAYTYTPTDFEFANTDTRLYALYPNGNPKDGGHGGNQYWTWASSGHAVRVQTGRQDPDQLPGAKSTFFSIAGVTTKAECLRCHAGEGYLTTKVSQVTDDRFIQSVWKGFNVTTQTAGFMGQECVVCHDPHPADADIAGSIRSADPAGVRSNFGRTTANASVCEDCHNWQVEVMSNGLPLAEFTPQSLPGRVNHPQRELLHGVKRGTAPVMWEVADMGEFMPGAKCQDCHMPKTDTSAEYTSHRMMIQAPGDAAAWNATGEDSCTTCHEEAGATIAEARTALQGKLDEWQSDAVSVGTAAKAALDAARLRPEYTTGGTGAKELYGRAWLNWSAYAQDGSRGAHNPPYIAAGLQAAKRMADSVGGVFDQVYVSKSLSGGSLGAIAAHVDNGDGTSAAGAKVALERYNGSTWVQQTSAVADSNGNVSFLLASLSGGTHTFRFRWDRCSSNTADKFSGNLVVSVTKRASSTTLLLSATSPYAFGRTVYARGTVTPNAAGQSVTIYSRKSTSSTWTRTVVTLDSSSRYSRAFKPTSRGTWYYRTLYGGSGTVVSSWSSLRTLVVN